MSNLMFIGRCLQRIRSNLHSGGTAEHATGAAPGFSPAIALSVMR